MWRIWRMWRMWRMMMITYSGFDHWGFTMFYHVSPCFTHEKVTVKGTPKSNARHIQHGFQRVGNTCAQKCTCHAVVGDGAWSMTSEQVFLEPPHTGTASTISKKERNPGPLKTARSYPPRKCLALSLCMFIAVCDQDYCNHFMFHDHDTNCKLN